MNTGQFIWIHADTEDSLKRHLKAAEALFDVRYRKHESAYGNKVGFRVDLIHTSEEKIVEAMRWLEKEGLEVGRFTRF